MTDKQPEALIRADELEAIGAESSLARTMAAHTIRLLYKENEALRAALAQPEQEPVACIDTHGKFSWMPNKSFYPTVPIALYTAPPQREWQGLTEMEVMDICNFAKGQNGFFFVREVEAKLKEKNGNL